MKLEPHVPLTSRDLVHDYTLSVHLFCDVKEAAGGLMVLMDCRGKVGNVKVRWGINQLLSPTALRGRLSNQFNMNHLLIT